MNHLLTGKTVSKVFINHLSDEEPSDYELYKILEGDVANECLDKALFLGWQKLMTCKAEDAALRHASRMLRAALHLAAQSSLAIRHLTCRVSQLQEQVSGYISNPAADRAMQMN